MGISTRAPQSWLRIDSPDGAKAAIRRASWFSVLHGMAACIIAGFVLFEGRPETAGFDHRTLVIAAFLCLSAFRVANGSMIWLCLLMFYETFNVIFCVLSVREPEQVIAQLPYIGVGIVAWIVYASGVMGAEYLRSHSTRALD
jgi:hypothetical protein